MRDLSRPSVLTDPSTADPVLDVRRLRVEFRTEEDRVLAVDDISFRLGAGRVLGLVGESGSGKSVTALAIMGLIPSPPGRISQGEIHFRDPDGGEPVDLLQLPPAALRRYRGGRIATIFQEPMSALNPVYTCGFQLVEAIRLHRNVSAAAARRQAIALLQEVKLLAGDDELRQRYLAECGTEVPDERAIQRHINQQKRSILDRYPHELSGGQLQRVTIAMAISCDPAVLIADEPTTALDVTVQARILDLLRELRDRRGMSIIFVSHDLGTIAEIADDVAVMYRGQIVETGSTLDIFSNPQHPYTQGLLACRPQPDRRLRYLPTIADFTAARERGWTGELADEPAIADGNGRPAGDANGDRAASDSGGEDREAIAAVPQPAELPDALPEPVRRRLSFEDVPETELADRLATLEAQAPLISARNLRVAFPVRGLFGRARRYIMAVNDVSFDIHPGETLGLVGESGCGKSTLARTLLHLIRPTGGEVLLDGENIFAQRGRHLRQLRRDLQIVFQDPYSSLDPRMTVGGAIAEPLVIHAAASGRERRDRVAYLLDRVGLNPAWANRYPHEFSGGQRQRICIARALALNPRFVICDESVSALDVSVQAQVLNLLKELQQEFGLTYLFISHDLAVVKFMSDRIAVMNQGKLEELGPAERVYRQPQRDYTQNLIDAIPTGSLDRIRQRQAERLAVGQ